MYETKMAGIKDGETKLHIEKHHYNKKYGYKAVRRQDFCHKNTGLRKKCIKDRANNARKSWQFFVIYQNSKVSLRY